MHELTVFQKLPNPFGWIQFRAVCRERDKRHVSRHDEVVGLSVEARAIDNDGGVVRRRPEISALAGTLRGWAILAAP